MSTGAWIVDSIIGVALALAFGAQSLRWLRVLQREHYDPAALPRFLGRWTAPPVGSPKATGRARQVRPISLSYFFVVALLVTVVLHKDLVASVVSVGYGVLCPWGLSIKGRTSALQWTRRLKTVALVATTLAVFITVAGAFSTRPWLAALLTVWAVPVLLDVTTRVLAPYERRKSNVFVAQAVERLKRVHPRIVAITGSFGKTSTKNHLAALLGESGVVASPRSFNNRAGLSRAINENLSDGTTTFIAEMGTYGPGEIRELCSWCVPSLSVVTAIGPVHLERMKSLDVIDAAKYEITENASTVVLNVDDVRLARWVPRLQGEGKRVRTAGSRTLDASVRVYEEARQWVVSIDGDVVTSRDPIAGVQPTNLACALAAALEIGTSIEDLTRRLSDITPIANRSNVVVAPSGVLVIDDTFNANPSSADASLALLSSLDVSGRRVVVTPGIVELGHEQYPQNLLLAQKVETFADELVIVGRTNARALEAGYAKGAQRFDTRDEAVAWVRKSLVAGDGVLYLNDLPDHYP